MPATWKQVSGLKLITRLQWRKVNQNERSGKHGRAKTGHIAKVGIVIPLYNKHRKVKNNTLLSYYVNFVPLAPAIIAFLVG